MTLWERMEKVAETLERQADADLQMRLYNHSCAYQNAAGDIRNALREHAMRGGYHGEPSGVWGAESLPDHELSGMGQFHLLQVP